MSKGNAMAREAAGGRVENGIAALIVFDNEIIGCH